MADIDRLSREQKPLVLDVLTAAFYDYPVMRFICRSQGREYEKDLQALLGFFCEIRFLRNSLVLGLQRENAQVGVALVDTPSLQPRQLPEQALSDLRAAIGKAAYERLVKFEELSSQAEPPEPHHYLGMIGIHPAQRGKGYAGLLLNAVRALCWNDPASSGISLSTEDPRNVSLYERFGYRVIGEADIDGMHSWNMYLKKPLP